MVNKVLVLHTSYQNTGGEDVVFFQETKSLIKYGLQVEKLNFSNWDFTRKGPFKKFNSLLKNKSNEKKVLKKVSEFKPDIIHIHNPMFELPADLILNLQKLGIPIIHTLHNYRPFCIGANLWRESQTCTLCLDQKSHRPGVKHKCYRGSKLASIALARFMENFKNQKVYEKISAFITLSENQKEIFLKSGFDPKKVFVKPNYLFPEDRVNQISKKKDQYIFVGRITDEKGILNFVEAWGNRSAPELLIIGDGLWSDKLQEIIKNNSNVEWKAQLPRADLLEEIKSSKALIAPFLWEEPFGLVTIEALAKGTPVIGHISGATKELVQDGITGKIVDFTNHEKLNSLLDYLDENPSKLLKWSKNAIEKFPEDFLEKKNVERLIRIYNEVLDSN